MKILRSGAFWSILTLTVVIGVNGYMGAMGHHECSLVVFLIYLIAYLTGMRVGVLQGRKTERDRVMCLCQQTITDTTLSPSVRRVMNGIAENRTHILSEDEFFGPQPGSVSSVYATRDLQE